MPKKVAGLTARFVQTIAKPGLYADGDGLYLQVSATGTKSWIFRYSLAGRRRDMGLGAYPKIALARVREKAEDARALIDSGNDPIDVKKAAKAAPVQEPEAAPVTFQRVAEEYVHAKRPGWRSEKHAAQWLATLERYAFPQIGAMPIADVDTAAVLSVLEPIWLAKPETAARLRGRIEMILAAARVKGLRSGDNPAAWRNHLDHVLPARGDVARVEHHAALDYRLVPAFWPRLQVQDGLGARALEFAILTAGRTGEVLGATWGEIDIEAGTWAVPASRMKAHAEHRVPLTDPTIALLRKLATIRQNDFVFPGQSRGRPLSNMAMQMVLRRMKVEVTPHGFRSSFRTWAAEQTDAEHEVAEACLAHTQRSKVVAAYQRGSFFEKRRALMAAWAAYCTAPLNTSGGPPA